MQEVRILCALALAAVGCKTSAPGGRSVDAAPADEQPDASAEEVCVLPEGDTSGKLVRVVFLVPSDRDADLAYVANLEHALRTTQLWLADRMPGRTSFRVHEPPVEVFATPHTAEWYATQPNPADEENPTHWFWNNAIDDGFAVTGGMFGDPDNIWIYYLQADRACGQADGGVNNVALLPENDLRGLAGEEIVAYCDETPEELVFSRCRWVGGMLLRILNALELPPPLACTDEDDGTPCEEDIVTRSGFKTFPEATLSDDQLDYLEDSPWVRAVGLPECTLECEEPVAP